MQITRAFNSGQFWVFINELGKETRRQFDQFNHIKTEEKARLSILDGRKNWFGYAGYYGELVAYGFLQKLARKKKTMSLGIVVDDKHQRHGYGYQICKAMIDWAWKHHYNKIWLGTYEDNVGALKLYKRLGFELEGIFVDDLDDGRAIYSLAVFNGYVGAPKRTQLQSQWLML